MRSALSIAVRDLLRAPPGEGGLGLSPAECELAPFRGQPPPECGERFVGVYTGGRANRTPAAGFDETYSVVVVLTLRAPAVPFDRQGTDLLARFMVGFDALSDAVRWCVGRDFAGDFGYTDGLVLARANAEIARHPRLGADDTYYPFETGLQFLGDDDPAPVGADWFHAEEGEPLAGVVQALRFGNARRSQSFFGPGVVT